MRALPVLQTLCLLMALVLATGIVASTASAQTTLPFVLQDAASDTLVSVGSDGTLTPHLGLRFTDGTLQTTAASGGSPSPWNTTGSTVHYTDGRVGIGTASPAGPLHVLGAGGLAHARIESNSTIGTWLNLVNTADGGQWNLVSTGSGNGEGPGALVFNNGASRMTLLPNGKLGIGTTRPGSVIANSRLDVIGGHIAIANDFGVFSYNSAGTGVGAGFDTTQGDGLDLFAGGLPRLRINSTGGIAMGHATTASGNFATATGSDTVASGISATAMGSESEASGAYATATGRSSTASGSNSTAMGQGTTASGPSSFAVGVATTASGSYSVAMGADATASGTSSFAVGGATTASGHFSVAMGRFASTNGRHGTFIFGDASSGNTLTPFNVDNSFVVRASGGFVFRTNPQLSTGCRLNSGSGSWDCTSSRNEKTDFEDLQGEDVLARLAAIPIQRWRYNGEETGVRHVGPTAEDFFEAFGLGNSDESIGHIDAVGITMRAVQALEARTRTAAGQDPRIEALERENEELRKRLAALERSVARLTSDASGTMMHTATSGN